MQIMEGTMINITISPKIPTDGDVSKPIETMNNVDEAEAIRLFLADPRFKRR